MLPLKDSVPTLTDVASCEKINGKNGYFVSSINILKRKILIVYLKFPCNEINGCNSNFAHRKQSQSLEFLCPFKKLFHFVNSVKIAIFMPLKCASVRKH